MKNYKKDFPLLEKENVVYLDSAATSQKPEQVIKDIQSFYTECNANVHRGVYGLSVKATEKFSNARHSVANFLNAKEDCEIVFTKNATEALNLVAYSYGLQNIKKGDEIVLSIMEHHSNIVPWQMVAKQKGAVLKFLYLDKNYGISKSELNKITTKTKVVGIVSVSNVLGTKNDIKSVVSAAHKVGAVVVADITQSVAHEAFDVQKTNVDFAVFSGHKMYGPLGIGVLYGKKALLENMPPFLMGGDMIEYVEEQSTTFAPLPTKFEAGTQNVAGAVGLAGAINYINSVGYKNIKTNEDCILNYAIKELKKLKFIELYLPPKEKHAGVISFNIKGVHAHDVSSFLDAEGVCVRSGNHCAQPLLKFLKLDSTLRISFGIYNTKQDVDKLVLALKKTYSKFEKYLGR